MQLHMPKGGSAVCLSVAGSLWDNFDDLSTLRQRVRLSNRFISRWRLAISGQAAREKAKNNAPTIRRAGASQDLR